LITTLAEIERELKILNSYFKKEKFDFKRFNGYIHLMANDNSKDISLGNTKLELYYQLLTANKILEELKNEQTNKIKALIEEYYRKIDYITERNKTVKSFNHLKNELNINNELIESYKTIIANLEELLN
jgi:hypothetical protein